MPVQNGASYCDTKYTFSHHSSFLWMKFIDQTSVIFCGITSILVWYLQIHIRSSCPYKEQSNVKNVTYIAVLSAWRDSRRKITFLRINNNGEVNKDVCVCVCFLASNALNNRFVWEKGYQTHAGMFLIYHF